MADDDNFDIDIYGDDGQADPPKEPQPATQANGDESSQQGAAAVEAGEAKADADQLRHDSSKDSLPKLPEGLAPATADGDIENQQISSTGGSTQNQIQPPKKAPVQQGVKRNDGPDERLLDPGATAAVVIADLHWWNTEDDIRGWVNQCGCEDELREIAFNEHKVNGKSKGQAYVLFQSPQAATALKHQIESFSQGQSQAKKFMVTYHAPHINPYKTLPKDIPNRKDGSRPDNRAGPVGYGGQTNHGANVPNHFHRNNFGNRAGGLNGGYNNRGGGVVAGIGPAGGGGGGGGTGAGVGVGGMVMGFNGGGRNFSTPMVGMANGNFATAAAAMGGFAANPMNAMAQFGNFGRGGMMMGGGMRGGMQNLRGGAAAGGGRGGMASGMMANMIMPNMGGLGAMTMGGMGAAMAMPTGMPGATGFVGGQAQFNPNFFVQGHQAAGAAMGAMSAESWNPHGAKRPRAE